MPESPRSPRPSGESGNGDADSKRGLWNAIRRFFDEAFNGAAAERRLHYDVARNMYRFR